jgi:hypothetical protein
MASTRRSHSAGLLYNFAYIVINIVCLYTIVLDAAHVRMIKKPKGSKASKANDDLLRVGLTLVERAASTGAGKCRIMMQFAICLQSFALLFYINIE